MRQYPVWPGNGQAHTRLTESFANGLYDLQKALDVFAMLLKSDRERRVLSRIINQFEDILDPAVMCPLGDGRWNPRGLSGCIEGPLGPDDRYLPPMFDVIEDAGEMSDLTVLQGELVPNEEEREPDDA